MRAVQSEQCPVTIKTDARYAYPKGKGWTKPISISTGPASVFVLKDGGIRFLRKFHI
jgi:hypothetical protein